MGELSPVTLSMLGQGSIYWGRQGGSFPPLTAQLPPPPPPKGLPVIVIVHIIIQDLCLHLSNKIKFSLQSGHKMPQFLRFMQEGAHPPPAPTPYSHIVDDYFPPKFQILDKPL